MAGEWKEGLPVLGFQPQHQSNIDKVNVAKQLEEGILSWFDMLAAEGAADKRWLAIARTNIEQGFMAANRAVFQPPRIKLPDDTP